MLSLDLLPAFPAGLGCCLPMLGIVVALEFPSALDPPFTIAVAIVEIGQGWCPDGQPPTGSERPLRCTCLVSQDAIETVSEEMKEM